MALSISSGVASRESTPRIPERRAALTSAESELSSNSTKRPDTPSANTRNPSARGTNSTGPRFQVRPVPRLIAPTPPPESRRPHRFRDHLRHHFPSPIAFTPAKLDFDLPVAAGMEGVLQLFGGMKRSTSGAHQQVAREQRSPGRRRLRIDLQNQESNPSSIARHHPPGTLAEGTGRSRDAQVRPAARHSG